MFWYFWLFFFKFSSTIVPLFMFFKTCIRLHFPPPPVSLAALVQNPSRKRFPQRCFSTNWPPGKGLFDLWATFNNFSASPGSCWSPGQPWKSTGYYHEPTLLRQSLPFLSPLRALAQSSLEKHHLKGGCICGRSNILKTDYIFGWNLSGRGFDGRRPISVNSRYKLASFPDKIPFVA